MNELLTFYWFGYFICLMFIIILSLFFVTNPYDGNLYISKIFLIILVLPFLSWIFLILIFIMAYFKSREPELW